MSVDCHTYILIGVPLDDDWGKLPTDGQGDRDASDDWHDRWGHLRIYEPKCGDLVFFNNIDGKRPYIGRVIDHTNDKWDRPEFNETFDVERLQREIDEVAPLLGALGITEQPKLIIYTNVT